MQAEKNEPMPTETLVNKFVPTIQSCPRMLVILAPFDKPETVRRLWCLFEVGTASRFGCQIQMAIPPTERAALRARLIQGDVELMIRVLSAVNSRRATASVPQDMVLLQKKIAEIPKGNDAIDEMFRSALRAWIAQTGQELVTECPDDASGNPTLEEAYLARTVGLILLRAHVPHSAIDLFKRAKSILGTIQTPNSKDVAAINVYLGRAYTIVGDPKTAITLISEALDVQKSQIPYRDKTIALTLSALAGAHLNYEAIVSKTKRGRKKGGLSSLKEAIRMLREARRLLQQRRDDAEAQSLLPSVLCSLGVALNRDGNIKQAIEIHQHALDIELSLPKQNGKFHPDIAYTYFRLARALIADQQWDKANDTLEMAREHVRTTVGPEDELYGVIIEEQERISSKVTSGSKRAK